MGRRPRRRPGGATTLRTSKILTPDHEGYFVDDDKASDAGQATPPKKDHKSFRRLSVQEEGVLYTVKVSQDHPAKNLSKLGKLKAKLFGRIQRDQSEDAPPARDDVSEASDGDDTDAPPPQSGDAPNGNGKQTLRSLPSMIAQQYTVAKVRQPGDWKSWLLCRAEVVDAESYLYKPSKPLARYINWTFYTGFTKVFTSFLLIFIVLCLAFAGLFMLCGNAQPECIIVSGEHFGTNPNTKFGDAFALSWTTFTTVGYGNVYTATGSDYVERETEHCSGVVFLSTLEAFMGLLYAGMCAAILFGKVNRVQSHAHLTFANAVCLQYEDVELDQFVDEDSSDSDCDEFMADEYEVKGPQPRRMTFRDAGLAVLKERTTFRDHFKGCPVLKFQVVNDLCNKGGGEIIDGVMKVVGIKLKRWEGKVSHSQYVRVNLVDYEHPFFGRVWHGVHILDGTSPLLTDNAKHTIKENGGSWPEKWLERPSKIRKKLDFHSLVVTVSGISNVSACTVHAYKRYKLEDVIIGFDFAPLVYENEKLGKLEVDLSLVNDVNEQYKGRGEDLKVSSAPVPDESSHSTRRTEDYSRGTSTIFKNVAAFKF